MDSTIVPVQLVGAQSLSIQVTGSPGTLLNIYMLEWPACYTTS